jgi:RimJ/RimL family protein N-acetyltransferase
MPSPSPSLSSSRVAAGLEVFASNARAIALYESLGFVREGLKRRVRKLDGRYDDDVMRALFLDEPPEGVDG